MHRNDRSTSNWDFRGRWGAVVALVLAIPSVAQNPRLIVSRQTDRVVVVSIPDRRLVVVENEKVIGAFPVAVGAMDSPSPAGEFRIVNRVTNPTYYHPGSVIPSGKGNPIGTRWLGLSRKGYGIHGTNAPKSVGRAASHGCIRLRNRDMEHLFAMLRIGDRVQIHGERDEQVARFFGSGNQEETVAAVQVPSPAGGQ